MNKINVKRIDKSLPLPEYQTSGSVGLDLYSREDMHINPKEAKLVPTNIIVKIPEGHMMILTPRSSLFKKKGLIMINSIGIIDQDYHGDKDENFLNLYNITDDVVNIEKGDRLAQAIFVKISKFELEESDKSLKDVSRGGFGSTG